MMPNGSIKRSAIEKHDLTPFKLYYQLEAQSKRDGLNLFLEYLNDIVEYDNEEICLVS